MIMFFSGRCRSLRHRRKKHNHRARSLVCPRPWFPRHRAPRWRHMLSLALHSPRDLFVHVTWAFVVVVVVVVTIVVTAVSADTPATAAAGSEAASFALFTLIASQR